MRNPQKSKTVLGLFLGGGRLAFAEARQGDAVPVVTKQGTDAFALAPGQDAPEVIATKLREILSKHRIKAKHCVLALPLAWVVSSRFAAAEIAESALADVAALELERLSGAPVMADQLTCFPADAHGQAFAVAVEPGVAKHLSEAFRLAGLTLSCFVPAVAGCRAGNANGTVVDVLPLPDEVDAVVRCDGRSVALRQLALHREGSAQRMAECLRTAMRSLQVTLSSVHEGDDAGVSIRVLGGGLCADELTGALRQADWSLHESPDAKHPPSEQAAVMAASSYWEESGMLAVSPPPRERRSHWWNGRAGRPLVLGIAAAVIAILSFVAAFTFRRLEVLSLEARLKELAPEQKEAETLRDELRLTATWYSQTPEILEVLKAVTEAFPDRGTVWSTELTVETDGRVTLAGCARDQNSWLAVFSELQKRTVDLSVVRARQGTKPGEPMTFLVTFSMPGPGHGRRA